MRPYLNGFYSVDRAKEIINIFDAQGFYFDNLATQAYFADELSKIRTKEQQVPDYETGNLKL